MKIIVTGTRGIPDVMGGVETHCEELFPRIARRGEDVTVIRRKNYVHDGLTEWNGVKLIDIESPKQKSFEAIVHTFKAVNKAKQLGADVLHTLSFLSGNALKYKRDLLSLLSDGIEFL